MYYEVESKEELVKYLLNFIKFEREQVQADSTFVGNLWYDIEGDIRNLYKIEE